MLKYFFIFLLISVLSCRNKQDKQTVSQISVDPVVTVTDTLQDTVSIADLNASANILTTGSFHGDEVWESAHTENWFGIFSIDTGYVLQKTQIITQRVFDGLLDNEDEASGWEVQTKNNENCIMLISGLNYLYEHDLAVAPLSFTNVIPGDTIRFNFLGVAYELYGTGTNNNPMSEEVIPDYGLYLSRGDSKNTIKLPATNLSTIIWSGDIDGDKLLDMIINVSDHYNVSEPALFLSKPAGDEILRQVGSHRTVGC